MDIAAVMSAVRKRISASAHASASMPSIPSVPLMSESPSLVSSLRALRPAARSAGAAGFGSPSPDIASPSPTRTSATCPSGARSPPPPTAPQRRTTGVTPPVRAASRASSARRPTPDRPLASGRPPGPRQGAPARGVPVTPRKIERTPAGAFFGACLSRCGDVARFHWNPTLHLDHPRRSLVEVLAKRGEHAPLRQVLDQLPHDVAVRAQHHLVELGLVEESIRCVEPSAFAKAWFGLDLQLVRARDGLDGLHASQVRAAVDRREVVGGEVRDELFGLLHGLLAGRALAAVAGPMAASPGLGTRPDKRRPQ